MTAGTTTKAKAKSAGKKAEPLTPQEQRRRFEEAARDLDCDDSEKAFNAALDVIGRYRLIKQPEQD